MKKLKQKQLGHWCSYCEPKTTRAGYVNSGVVIKYSCDEHKGQLLTEEKQEQERDQRYTEADNQTWGRL